MSRILELVTQELDGRSLDALAEAIDMDRRRTGRVAVSILTATLGKLRDHARSDLSAEELHRSIKRREDPALVENLPRRFSVPPTAEEDAVADDVFGIDRAGIEERLADQHSLPSSLIHRLTATMAGLMVGVLALHLSTERLDSQGLANDIVGDARELWQKEPQAIDAMRRWLGTESDLIEASAAVDGGIRALG